jgi:cellulose synthase/poly-beta-1,6-N-acetylglucosamine synthase-like glycosyltransferase
MDVEPLILWIVVLANLAFFPFYAYLIIVSLAALFSTTKRPLDRVPQTRFQVMIPAHDEEAGISSTVRSCLELDYPQALFEVVVIADNCVDQTASLAQQQGATVVERFDASDRSKGFALKFWFDRLIDTGRIDDLDAIVVIDADSVVDSQLLRVFSRHLEEGRDWVQGFDTVSNTCDSWRTRLMAYSFGLINGVLLQGQTALGLSGALRGNGMCLSTRGLRRFPWNKYGLVEDLEYSWSLRLEGETIAFAPDAIVRASMLAGGGTAAIDQRRRWEFGRGEIRRQVLGPLLRSTRLKPLDKIAAVIELCMPTMVGLASLCFLSAILIIRLLLASSATGSGLFWTLVSLSALALLSLSLYGLAPFFILPMRVNLLVGLIHFPPYALWKLSILFHRRPNRWIRTPREGNPAMPPPNDSNHSFPPNGGPSEASLLGR